MAKRSRKSARIVEVPSPLLERLKAIASASGLDVREERLLREAGYSVKSGVCRVSDHEVLLLDKNATTAERIEVMCSLLSRRDLDTVFIEPDLRRAIGGRAMPVDDDPAVVPAALADATSSGEGQAAPVA